MIYDQLVDKLIGCFWNAGCRNKKETYIAAKANLEYRLRRNVIFVALWESFIAVNMQYCEKTIHTSGYHLGWLMKINEFMIASQSRY